MNPYRTVATVFITFGLFACPGQTPEAKTTEKAVVKVADDTCHEVTEEGLAPDWVALLCDATKVLLPRQEWHAIKARRIGTVDAGPGK